MTKFEAYLILHLVGAFLLVAAAGLSTAAGTKVGRVTDPRTTESLLALQHRNEFFVELPGAALAVIFGSLLVGESAAYSYSDGWVVAAYVLLAAVLALDYGVLFPFTTRIRRQAQALIAEGVTESEELRRLAASPRGVVLGNAIHLAYLGFIYLMVAKPGA